LVQDLKAYKYLSGNTGALKILSDGTIKFTEPRTFNDPFDCAPYIEVPDKKDILKNRSELVKRVMESLQVQGSHKFSARNKAIQRLITSIKNGDFFN